MARHLHYNPGRDSIEYLEAITCGENRLYILDQLLISLRAEIGRPNHQHHLLIGPRGAGKTHLLRLLTAGRIPQEPALAAAYLPVIMPEETPLRSPGDLYLKFVERLADLLKEPPPDIPPDAARKARGLCMTALTTAKGIRDPLERLEVMAGALEAVATALERIILPIAENMDQTFYLGAQRSRKGPLDEQWALRRHLQETPHIFLIAAAPSIFGAVGDPGKPFYDFFRTHELRELSNDEVLEIIRLRLKQEAAIPGADGMRSERVHCILDHFDEKTPQLRGLLAITGGLPRFTHLIYEVIVETDVNKVIDTLNGFLDDLTPYFQHRLDPRVIPQAEIDLLHTLALARGPQQPSELAAELYGVQTNEISELLGRLQERNLVKRAGRPGGQAVTWDLTEPLYRVWTQFRDNPDGQDMYRLLGKFVALLFTMDEIAREREELAGKLSLLPDDHGERGKLCARKRLVDSAYEFLTVSTRVERASFEESIPTTNYIGEKGDKEQDQTRLSTLRQRYHAAPDDAPLRENLAMGLFNAFNYAGKAGDMEQSRALLEELHLLSHTHPDDAPLREWLVKGLVNAIINAVKAGDKEQGRALLEELRFLSQANPDEPPLREWLAMGLVTAIMDAEVAGDKKLSRALLEELRLLSQTNPDEPPLRKWLAKGFVIAIIDAGAAGNKEQGLVLLEELRLLSHTNPDDAPLRENLANGLFNSIINAVKAGDNEQDLALREELRLLSRANPDEPPLRKWLAKGLSNAIINTGAAGDKEQGLALLEELRLLSHTNPDDAPLRENLAKGLFNSICNAEKAGDNEQGLALLEELRLLSHTHPDEEPLRKQLANGLVNAIHYAGKAGDNEQGLALLEELRLLSNTHPDEAPLREKLASGLFNASNYAGKAGDKEQRLALLEELRLLSQTNPDEAPLRENLAKGLFNTFYDAGEAGDTEQSMALLEELRLLSHTHPDEAPLHAQLAMGLFNAFNYAGKAGNNEQSRALLEELFDLMKHYSGEIIEESVQRAVMIYGTSLLALTKAGDTISAKKEMRWLESRMPSGMAELLRPMMLGMDVLEKGEEQALAREPEEMRRVVRMVLEKLVGKK